MKRPDAIREASMKDTALCLRLRPRIHPRILSFLDNKPLLFDLADNFGSPLNLVFPQNMQENIETFKAAYKNHNLRGKIYLSSKPCKSLALYREAADHGIGIDISSPSSLKAALNTGWQSAMIGATGPKNADYIDLAVRHDVLINVDNMEELRRIVSTRARLGLPNKARITVRVADYMSPRVQFMGADDNTFGIPTADMADVIQYLESQKDSLEFKGFSWHASVASDEQRIAAMENLLKLTFSAMKRGLNPVSINIGGGFPIMYADSCTEWNSYKNTLRSAVAGLAPPQTWNGNGLGFRIENGVLRGSPSFIDHAPVYTKGEELDRRLSLRLPSFGNARFSDIIRDSLLQLVIEPGRGMFDQCGITVSRVAFTKTSPGRNILAGLEMNRSNIHSDHLKQLTEPCVIPRGKGAVNTRKEGIFYIGNLCLAYDMLQYNKTYPDFMPETGDLVAFPNTAAYMMDFTESETLMQPVARKIALTEMNGAWNWEKDEDYRKAA